jgi:uncharacterized protein YegL
MTDRMSFHESPDEVVYDRQTFASGMEKRLSVCLLVDTSQSMRGPDPALGKPAPTTGRPIDQLNEALRQWASEIKKDARLVHRLELALISFGSGGVVVHGSDAPEGPFRPAAEFAPETLTASGVTPMFDAIREAIQLVERRKVELDGAALQRFRPLIFLVTDGQPTDAKGNDLPPTEWQPIARQIATLEEGKKLALFAAGVDQANVELLRALAPQGSFMIREGGFLRFFKFMSASVAASDPIEEARRRIAAGAGD